MGVIVNCADVDRRVVVSQAQIVVRNLSKTYRVPEREPGLWRLSRAWCGAPTAR